MDRAPTGTTALGQSGTGCNGNEKMPYTNQISGNGALPSNAVYFIPWTPFFLRPYHPPSILDTVKIF